MALTGSSFPQGGGNVGFPATGGNVTNRNVDTNRGGETNRGVETREEAKTRITAEDRALERANDIANDPYGLRQQQHPDQAGSTQRVLKRVRVKRNTGQPEGTSNTNGSNGTAGTEGARRGRGGPGEAGERNLLNQTMSRSYLNRASVLFDNQQAQNPQQTSNNLAVRNKMLNGLNNYIQNDYQMMKLNPDDKAFTYRTAEARQLGATIGQMVASTSRQGDKKANNTEDTSPRITPEAYGRQKGLLRRLAAMSEPNPRMPDNLPADYRPFESVA